jgi:hypothetical protein
MANVLPSLAAVAFGAAWLCWQCPSVLHQLTTEEHRSAAPVSSSRTALASFAEGGAAVVDNISDILVANYSTYSASACLRSTSAAGIRNALLAELSPLPAAMRAQIVQRAISEPCTASESKTALGGSSDVLFAFWHVACNSAPNVTYDICIAVAGAAVTFAEVVVGELTEVENVVVGHRPCSCTLFNAFCRTCPIIETVERVVPLKETPKLTSQQHADLAAVLQRHAANHANQKLLSDAAPLLGTLRGAPSTLAARTSAGATL